MPPLAQIDVSEHAADEDAGAAVTADHMLFAVVSASVAALTVFVIMMGVRSVLGGGRKAGSAAGAGDIEGGGSERSDAARERAQRWGAASAAGSPTETGDVGLEVDGAGGYEPHAPSSRAGGELDGDVALAEPKAPERPMGRASAGLSEEVRASAALHAALSRHLNEPAMTSATGQAALARAQGARLKRADSRAALRKDMEVGLPGQRGGVEGLEGSTLPGLSGVCTPSLPGGGTLPGGSTPPEEDPHTAPAPSARAPGALPRNELQHDARTHDTSLRDAAPPSTLAARVAPGRVAPGCVAPGVLPELMRESSTHDFSTWSQGRNSCEGKGGGGGGGGEGGGGASDEDGGGGGGNGYEMHEMHKMHESGGGEGGGGSSGGGGGGGGGGCGSGSGSGGDMPPSPSNRSSDDWSISNLLGLRRMGATVRGPASMLRPGTGSPPVLPG